MNKKLFPFSESGLATLALLAFFFIFGGSIWDNVKKYVERKFWMRSTPTHEAVVIGDLCLSLSSLSASEYSDKTILN
ncbi:MAG: sodium/proton-translocating pyrophosphatase [Thermoproteota archaeon]